MYILFTVLIVIAAILLILLVLVQNSKGGGLAAGFASGNQVMGAPRTADFLEKASWILAGVIVALSILAVGAHKMNARTASTDDQSQITEQVQHAAEAEAPAAVDFNAEQPAE